MSDGYTPPDLRQLMAERTDFPATRQTLEPFFVHHNQLTQYSPAPPPPPKYEPLLVLSEVTGFQFSSCDNSNVSTTAAGSTSAPFFRQNKLMENEWSFYGNDVIGGSNGNSRWPRQETLTLLEIRSRLDSKFKESNQKGPLWDQVSRIMADEYGYKRSGKKCKEKFDNLYKYYKKTKEGKTGRHDGKHYRFFRQLEAIYGDQSRDQISSPVSESHVYRNYNNDIISRSNPNTISSKIQHENQETKIMSAGGSLSFSISSDFETSSSGNYHDDDLSAIAFMMNLQKKEENENPRENESENNNLDRTREKRWKLEEVEKSVDSKLSELMETQEIWVENMMMSIERREKERMMRDEEWRKREAARFDREMHEFCGRERAWLEAREAALMEIMQKFAGRE